MPVFVMKATLPRSEFYKWLSYLQYQEPEIQEIQLVVLSTLVAKGLGQKSKVSDFILSKSKKPQVNQIGMSNSAVRSAFSGVAKQMK